jgi:hypothetical protein
MRPRWATPLAAAVVLAVLSAGAWFAWHPAPPAPAPVPRATPAFAIRTATEAEILTNTAGPLTIFRFAPNPRVLVLDFASLHEQGLMLNRVAALVEKAGLPRDRVFGAAELETAIRSHGETPDTYYYGHDYSAASLARFFELSDRDHIALTPEEQLLRALLEQEDMLRPRAAGALISIPHIGSDKLVDAATRATILHHELSHGEYFTNPGYAAYARRFYREVMAEHDRARFMKFLAAQDYDPADEDLMINETQAYLMHTADTRFFSAASVGMSEAELDRLRAAFLLGMPAGWLRDCTTVPPVAAPLNAAAVK